MQIMEPAIEQRLFDAPEDGVPVNEADILIEGDLLVVDDHKN